MTSYSGRHAELYDLFYKDKPYASEAAFVDWCIKTFSTGSSDRLLELACGTGTHAFELEKLGYQIVATDYSDDMLRRAKAKAVERSSGTEFQLQDMTSLNVNQGPFDVITCLFDAIGYVATNEALEQVFLGVQRHLRSGGLFIFEFWHAAAMIRHFDPVRVRRFETEESQILRISETSLEIAKQLSSVTYSVVELHRNGSYSTLTETQVNRYFLLQEMNAWLSSAGLKPLKWFAGFTADEEITDETWHIVAVSQRL